MISLKRRPRRIDDERGETEKNEERLNPPRIGARGLPERTLFGERVGVGHKRVEISNP